MPVESKLRRKETPSKKNDGKKEYQDAIQLWKSVGQALLALIFRCLLVTVIVWPLWNYVVPKIFWAAPLSFTQALALVLMSQLLFRSLPKIRTHEQMERENIIKMLLLQSAHKTIQAQQASMGPSFGGDGRTPASHEMESGVKENETEKMGKGKEETITKGAASRE